MIEKNTFGSLEYLTCYPKDYKEGESYPVIFFLHGAGYRGKDISVLYDYHMLKETAAFKDFPMIAVLPQCSGDSWFELFETVIGLAKHIYNSDFTDKKRFYGMGVSMGGYGMWQLAMTCPELFAAIVPICGGGMYWNGARLKNVPVWAFHGDSDPVVFTEESKKMTDAVNANGGNARITVYENCEHDAWTATFANPKVYEWLLEHTKSDAVTGGNGFDDGQLYG